MKFKEFSGIYSEVMIRAAISELAQLILDYKKTFCQGISQKEQYSFHSIIQKSQKPLIID